MVFNAAADILGRTYNDFRKEMIVSHNGPGLVIPEGVEVLQSPDEYYKAIRRGIQEAQHTIVLSALYLGCGSLEHDLVSDLLHALNTRPKLQVTLILDHSRSQRVVDINASTLGLIANLDGAVSYNSTRTTQNENRLFNKSYPGYFMMLPLLKDHSSRCRVLLFQVPQVRSSPVSRLMNLRPSQWATVGEVMGVYHAKFCIFDEECLLTGANLSHEYFVNRQDRYMRFPKSPILAPDDGVEAPQDMLAFLRSFCEAIAPHCHSVDAQGKLQAPPQLSATELGMRLRQSLQAAFATRVRRAQEPSNLAVHTIAYPLLQLGNSGIQDESRCLPPLLLALASISNAFKLHTEERPRTVDAPVVRAKAVVVTSPYPSFQPPLCQALSALAASSTVPVTIIAPCVSSHGFGSATGVKAFIPKVHEASLADAVAACREAYRNSHLTTSSAQCTTKSHEEECMESVEGSADGFLVTRYAKAGWTYHAKGLWATLQGSARAGLSTAELTYIGSSNLGARSAQRDLELGFIMVTKEPALQAALLHERRDILQHCSVAGSPVSNAPTAKGKISSVGRIIQVFSRVVRSYF